MSIWPQADVPCAAVERGGLVSPVTACLVAVYGAECGRGDVRRERAIVDDAAAARLLRLHQAEGVLGAQEDAGQVHVHDRAPLLDAEGVDRKPRRRHPGIVEEHVEPAECGLRLGEQLRDRLGVRHIGRAPPGCVPAFSPAGPSRRALPAGDPPTTTA